MYKIIKRNGNKVPYSPTKIKNAISLANSDIDNIATQAEINVIYETVKNKVEKLLQEREISVDEINDIVEETMMRYDCYELAKQFIEYRYRHKLIRESNTTDESIFELINGTSEYWNRENSNKNAKLLTTQRDYIAGITSTDIARRFIFPKKSVEAHDQGIIHIHDMDYAAEKQRINCCLVNLEDMLQNGTVLNGITIEKPHRFITACTIATQIIVAVSASNYGGTTITLTHLAPFVRCSFYRHFKFYIKEVLGEELNSEINEDTRIDSDLYKQNQTAYNYAVKQVKKEVEDGVQTFNYQVNSMSSTNGQAPFLSVCMYLGETDEYKDELAMIIEEFLIQRTLGMKNPQGVYITVAFPKLLYVLEKDNIEEGSKYWYLTQLAAKCSAKRLVPDYISEKVMKEYKVNQINGEGDAYPCMGCLEGQEVVTYKLNSTVYIESFERMWNRLGKYYEVKTQKNGKDFYMETPDVKIYDQKKGFVDNLCIIKNHNKNWLRLTFSDGRVITCTPDHPFETKNGRIMLAKDLTGNIEIDVDAESKAVIKEKPAVKTSLAWAYGVMLNGISFNEEIEVPILNNRDSEVYETFCNIMHNIFDVKLSINPSLTKNRIITIKYDKEGNADDLAENLIELFGGKEKCNRYIPNKFFSWDNISKINVLAGLIDAGAETKDNETILLSSLNKELMIQTMILAQSCGMPAKLYAKNKNYKIEFVPTPELLRFTKNRRFKDLKPSVDDVINKTCHLVKVETFKKEGFSYDVTTTSEHFTVSGLYSHNCRSFLTPDRVKENVAKAINWKEGTSKYYGRFNMGVASVNIPAVAVLSKGDLNEFWKLLDNYCELCHDVLKVRIKRLEECTSDIAPILYQYGAFARLDKGESLKPLIYGGYATISLGYAGLYETIKFFTGKSNTEKEGIELQKQIMQFLNDKCNEWKKAENIDYSLYGTPIENTVGKFAKAVHKLDKDFFIKIDGKDRDFVTNSYHVFVEEEIDAFDKLALEGEYQKLSPGGCISYVESADLTSNTEVVLELLKFMYDHTMYAEINTKSDYCQVCGFDKEIEIVDNNHKLMYRCPNCGNTDDKKMNVARRVCGYISTNIPNQSRLEEIANRYVHIDNHI